MLEAHNISRVIGHKRILEGCSLQLSPGRFTAVVGPNGAGKTTLLKIITGETKKYGGEVTINGKLLRQYTTRDLSKIRAVLPQQTTVNFPFTVHDVIRIGRYAHSSTEAENNMIIAQAMKLTGLTKLTNRIYQTLSGGEMQRVQMARIIAQVWGQSQDTRYVILDEPTSSLDLAQQHALLSVAKTLCQQNIAVMAILHDLNLAVQYADDILFLKKGKATAYGPLRSIAIKEVIEHTFDHPVRLLEDNDQMIIVPHTGKHNGTGTKEIGQVPYHNVVSPINGAKSTKQQKVFAQKHPSKYMFKPYKTE